VSNADAELSWVPVSQATKYQVFRSSVPYFQPGDLTSTLLLPEPTASPYSDGGVLTQVNAYFYLLKTVNAVPEDSLNSNRVGKFTYQLEPGN
jgi:hypothetical protein